MPVDLESIEVTLLPVVTYPPVDMRKAEILYAAGRHIHGFQMTGARTSAHCLQ